MAQRSFLDEMVRAGSNPQVVSPYPKEANQTDAVRFAFGSGTFVSGVATVNTGLATVMSFQTIIQGTSFATGATEVVVAVVSGAPATGAVTVQGMQLAAVSTKSASGTGTFFWLAFGT